MAHAVAERRIARGRRPMTWSRAVLWAITVVVAILVLVPLAYMGAASFTPESLVEQWPLLPRPKSPTLADYKELFSEPAVYIGRWDRNSIVITGSVTVAVLLLSSLTRQRVSRLRLPRR